MVKLSVRRAVGMAFLSAAMASHAALPSVSLSFAQPSGVAAADEPVEVWVTLKVDAGSSPLAFDAATPAPFGFVAADLPAQGNYNDTAAFGTGLADFATYTYVQTNTSYGCSGSFTNVCDPGAYAFDFHAVSTPGKPSFNFLSALNLQPGDSFDYLFGTFTPVGGAAPAGTYEFFSTYASLVFNGLDADGHDLYAYVDLGQTCVAGETAACGFTRTVSAVPEPETGAMLALGLLMVGVSAGRRRAR